MSDDPHICEECGSEDAVVHLTQIVNDEAKVFHLCKSCAASKGVASTTTSENFPLTDFLAQMGDPDAGAELGEMDESCSFCGLTFAGFREGGRLGCPHCYATFDAYLKSLLRRIHGGVQHVGKVYLPPDPTTTDREKRLEGLRRKLQRAINTEDFERAANLRDEIRTLEPAKG